RRSCKDGRVRPADRPVPHHAAPGVSEGKRRFVGRRDHAGGRDVSAQDGRVKRGLDRRLGDLPVTSPPNGFSIILHGNDSNRMRGCRSAAAQPLKGTADPKTSTIEVTGSMQSNESPPSPTGSGPVFRAAQYVRMSTEHQQYSTENQGDKIRE